MRAIVLSVVLVASPALAQQAQTATPATAPSTVVPPPVQPPAAPADSSQIPQAIDPMADLIAQQNGQPQTTDEEEVEAAGKPAPRHRATILPIPAPEPEAPAVPGGALTTAQIYELRVKGSIAAAQTLQGPLDGGWRVSGPDGAQLYALQIVDKAGGYAPLEGAWRDVRRPGAVGSTGLIDDLGRNGADLVIRFTPKGGQASILTLRPQGETRWAGELVEEGRTQTVVAEHLLPQAPAGFASQGRGPYVWPPRVAAVSRSAEATPACSTRGKRGKALKAAKARCAVAARKASQGGTLKRGKGGHHTKAAAGHRNKATSAKKGGAKKKRR
jgi:hypothetical protein